MWAGLEAAHLVQARRVGVGHRGAMLRSGAGLALALLLLGVGGGALTNALADSGSSGLSLAWSDDPGAGRRWDRSTRGPAAPAWWVWAQSSLLAPVLLAWRDRLVRPRLAPVRCCWPGWPLRSPHRGTSAASLGTPDSPCGGSGFAAPAPALRRFLLMITWPTVARPVRNPGKASRWPTASQPRGGPAICFVSARVGSPTSGTIRR